MYNAKATFFILGKHAVLFPETVMEIQKRGHLIGGHSYSHSRENDDIEKGLETVETITGEKIIFIRAPYNDWKSFPSLKSMKGKKIVGSTFHSYDWRLKGVEATVGYYTKNIAKCSVITMHDGDHKVDRGSRPDQMIEALPQILEKTKGFKYVRLDEMELVLKEVE